MLRCYLLGATSATTSNDQTFVETIQCTIRYDTTKKV